jgi:hypothetical protein
MYTVQEPFSRYYGLDGQPLNNGNIYFGQPNKNPETYPLTMYWDAAGLQPVAQPVKTTNGYIVRDGIIANVYVNQDYSITVKDKTYSLVYSVLSNSVFGANANTFDTLGQAIISTTLGNATGFTTRGYNYSGDGGGANYMRLPTAPGVPKPWQFPTADGTWWQLISNPINPKMFGAIGDNATDDRLAVQYCDNCAASLLVEQVFNAPFYCSLSQAFIAHVRFVYGGKLRMAANQTIIFNGGFTAPFKTQIFDLSAIGAAIGSGIGQAYVLTPFMFGAVGNGVTDDSVAGARAMAAEGDLYIPDGYTFNTYSEWAYQGSGSKFVYGSGKGSIINLVSPNSHVLRKIGLGALRVSNLSISSSVPHGVGYDAIRFEGNSIKDSVDNCIIYGISAANYFYNGVHSVSDVIPSICKNYFLNVKNASMLLENTTGVVGCEAIIEGNTIDTTLAAPNASSGIWWLSGAGTVRIYGNTFQNVDYGINIQLGSGTSNAAALITGNAFENCYVGGVVASLPAASTAQMQDLTVNSNRFNQPHGACIVTSGATNKGWINCVTFNDNSGLFGANYTVNVQAGVTFVYDGNNLQATGAFTYIATDAAYPQNIALGTNMYNVVAPYLFNGNPNVSCTASGVIVTAALGAYYGFISIMCPDNVARKVPVYS